MGYFILGILLVAFLLPLIDGLSSLFLTMIEALKGYFNVKIIKYNKEMLKIKEENEDYKPINTIGFTFEEDQEDEDDE